MSKREQLQLKFKKLGERLNNTPLMTILFATSTSLMLYQNCSVSEQSTSASSKSGAVYSSTIGGASGPLGPGTGPGTGSGGFAPIGAGPVVGGANRFPAGVVELVVVAAADLPAAEQ